MDDEGAAGPGSKGGPSPADSAQRSATPRYPLPPNLTAGGLRAFREEVARYAAAIGDELQTRAIERRAKGATPEHTAESVAEARATYEVRLRRDAAARALPQDDRRWRSDTSVLAAMLLTVATVGLGVIANFLNSAWQYGLFVGFAAVGVIGLGMTWVGRRSKR